MLWHRTQTLVASAALLLMTSLLLTACGSDPSDGAESATSATESEDASNTPVPTESETSSAEASFHAAEAGGDEASFTVSFGSPQIASDAGDSPISACTELGVDLDRAAALPVTIEGTLESSMSSKVTVFVSSVAEMQDGEAEGLIAGPVWAGRYGDDGDLCRGDSDGGGSVIWDDMQSGSTRSFTTWLILTNAISPDNPQATPSFQNFAFELPDVTFNTYDRAQTEWSGGSGLVTCSGRQLAAVFPDIAVSRGCEQ